MYRFAVLGSDTRMDAVKTRLVQNGFEITNAQDCDAVILPIGFKDTNQFCNKTVFAPFDTDGGYNYAKTDYFKTLNAIPTAEGAIALAMQHSERTIFESDCAVIGYGCIGYALSKRLSALGAKVTVYARSESALAKARADGMCSRQIGLLGRQDHDIIFNTVPAMVLGHNQLKYLKNTFIIDLASKPGGVDFEAADALLIKYVHALALPSKCAPVTAGEILADTVISILRGVK